MKRTSKFTDKALRAVKYTGKQVDYFDSGSPLILRVGAKKKTFSVRVTLAGKRKKIGLGCFPNEISLADARIKAEQIVINVKQGKALEQPQQSGVVRMVDLWNSYSNEEYFKQLAKGYQDNQKCYWKNDVEPYLGHRAVADVKRSELREVIQRKAPSAPVAANRLHSFLALLMVHAMDLDLIELHPMARLKRPVKEIKRDRVLSREEIKTLWKDLDNESETIAAVIKILLLTGQRVSEVVNLRWDDISDNQWHLSVNKTRSHHTVVFSTQAQQIIDSMPKVSEWVFTSPYRDRTSGDLRPFHSKALIHPRRRIMERTGLDHFTIHDLRRTFRTLASSLGIDRDTAERLINHAQSGIAAVYDRYDRLEETATAWQLVADEIYRIV